MLPPSQQLPMLPLSQQPPLLPPQPPSPLLHLLPMLLLELALCHVLALLAPFSLLSKMRRVVLRGFLSGCPSQPEPGARAPHTGSCSRHTQAGSSNSSSSRHTQAGSSNSSSSSSSSSRPLALCQLQQGQLLCLAQQAPHLAVQQLWMHSRV
jgi:hypothetical protein